MKQFGNAGYRIVSFKTIWGLDSKQSEAIRNTIKPVMEIPLSQNMTIFYTDTDSDSHMITNKVSRTITIIIFDGNMMFNQEDVEITESKN